MLRMRLLSRGAIWSRLELSVSLSRLPLLLCQMEKSVRLAEIQTQLQDTSQSVRKGKQLLSTLSDDIAHPVRHLDSTARSPLPVPPRGQNAHFGARCYAFAQSHPSPLLMPSRYAGTPSDSPQRILTTSSILSGRRQPR